MTSTSADKILENWIFLCYVVLYSYVLHDEVIEI